MKTIHVTSAIFMSAFVLRVSPALAAPENSVNTVGTGMAAPHSDNDENTRAQALYREALAAYKSQNYQDSRKLLLQIWTVRQTYDVASALAKTEMKLKMYRDAATHLQFCLDNFAPVSSKQTLESIKQMMAEAKALVGTLHIRTNRDGAQVHVDDRLVGVSPLKSPIYIEPGQHEVKATEGGDSQTEPIEVAVGQDLNVEVPLEHAATPPVIQGPPVPVSVPTNNGPRPTPFVPAEETDRSIVPVIIGGAIFAVGIGTGIGFRLASNSKYDDAKAMSDRNGQFGCYAASSSDCVSQHNATSKVDQYRNVSTAGLIAAGVAAIAVPVYWFWPSSGSVKGSAMAHKRLQVQSGASSQGAGIWFKGEF